MDACVHTLIYPSEQGSSPSGYAKYRSLTQLNRVPVFETGSWEFESLRAGQIIGGLV